MKIRKSIFELSFIISFLLIVPRLNAQDELRILPLGNSITRGSMCVNGSISGCQSISDSDAIAYRNRLFNLLSGAGYDFDFIGNQKFGYEIMSDPDNAGFSGIKSWHLADIIETGTSTHSGDVTPGPFLETYPADIILLHIGTNDVLAESYSVSHVNRLLNAVDNYESSSGSPVLVIVSKIISQNSYPCNTHPGTKSFNNNLSSMIQNRINNGDKIVFVDMECGAGLNYYEDLIDEVHPNQAGYDKMADLWFQAINNLNSAPVVSPIPDQDRDREQAFAQVNLDNYVNDTEEPPQNMNWSVNPSQPLYFDVVIDENRVATITPKDNQWSGSETIEFVATDNGNYIPQLKRSDAVSVEFTVNWTPEITGQETLTTAEDNPITLSINDLIIVEPGKAPADISLIIQTGSNYSVSNTTVIPDENFNGTLTVPVKISADGKESNTYNLEISVTSLNDIPEIISQLQVPEIEQETCIDIELSMLEVTDADNNYPADFTLDVLTGSNYTFNGTNVCPDPQFNGTLNVNLRVNDGINNSNNFTFTINVLASRPVFILPSDLEILEKESFSSIIEVDHFDPGAFSFSAVELPGWLDFNSSTKLLSGIPQNEDVGENEVTLRVSDGEITVDTTFIITVTNVNDPPVITSEPLLTASTGKEYNYTITAEDIDELDVLSYSYLEKPSWAGFNAENGLLSGTPSRDDTGVFNVTLKVSDGSVEVDQSFSINVQFFNFPPEIVTAPKDTAEVSKTYSYGIRAEDPENDPVSYFAKNTPDWLIFYPDTRVLIGTPGEQNAGDVLVVLGATDGIDTSYQAYTLQVVFATSRQGIFPEPGIRVYPNPASEKLNIFIEDSKLPGDELYFELTGINGQALIRSRIINNKYVINLDKYDISAGLYLFRIYNYKQKSKIKTGKIMIR